MMTWWQGTRLVATRGIAETLRSRAFRIVTALLFIAAVAAVTLPHLLGAGTTSYTLATVGAAPSDLVTALDAAGSSAGFSVEYVARDDASGVQDAVRTGDATVGLAGRTLYTPARQGGSFPVLLSQTLVSLQREQFLADAGLGPEQVARLQAIRPPDQIAVGKVQDEGRAGLGFAVGIALYLALTFAGSAIATTVATEKSSRISEVLLAVLRPSQVLVGTVLAVGTTTLAQIVVAAAPVAAARGVSGGIELPAETAGDLALAVVWFALGFVLYAVAFAAAAALVDKVTDVQSVVMPITLVMVLSYFGGIFIATRTADDAWSVVISMFPLSAPVAMPIRWASGEVPVYQLVIAMLLTAATAALMVRLGAAFYRRALLITGHRVKLTEVVRREHAA